MRTIQIGAVAMTALLCAACASTPSAAPAATIAPAATVAPAPTAAPTAVPVVAPTTAPIVAPASGAAVDEGDMRKMADALIALNSYSMHGQMKLDDGTSVDWLMEFAKPDKQHTKITTAKQTIENITIGKTEYMKLGPTWTKTEASDADTPSVLPFGSGDDLAQAIKEETTNGDKIVKGGLDMVDGAPCQIWTITTAEGEQTNACIGVTDSLPRRFSTPEGDLFFSDFNAPLKIEAPI